MDPSEVTDEITKLPSYNQFHEWFEKTYSVTTQDNDDTKNDNNDDTPTVNQVKEQLKLGLVGAKVLIADFNWDKYQGYPERLQSSTLSNIEYILNCLAFIKDHSPSKKALLAKQIRKYYLRSIELALDAADD